VSSGTRIPPASQLNLKTASYSSASPNPGRFHVRGFTEQGTTTTPFDMVVLNRMSRYHLVLEALRRSRRVPEQGTELAEYCQTQLARHHDYIRENFQDLPEIRDWRWTS
jgi:xylulose-5-phosphate/fructose-6-phosphate phosphoketolase